MSTTKTLDFDARYEVEGSPGIAWLLIEYGRDVIEVEVEDIDLSGTSCWSYHHEIVEDRSFVLAIMVGDNRRHEIDVDDLVKLDEDDYCHACGQIGCTHDGRDRG